MNNKIYAVIVLLIAAFVGIVLAVDIGSANYEQLGIYAVVGIILYFFINGWRNVWWFTALLIFSGVGFYQAFDFNAEHLFVMMLGLASLMFIISRGPLPQPSEFRIAGSRSTAIATGIVLFYGLIHFIIYYGFPYSPTQYSVKTSTKAYFECYASMFCFFWLLVGPYGFSLKPSWPKSLVIIMIFCLAGNVTVRGMLFLMGFQASDGLSDDSVGFGTFTVPAINMYPGVYTLRSIAPLICLLIFMIISSKRWWNSSGSFRKFMMISSIGLCLVGAIFSGGRATFPLCIVFIVLGSLMRGRINLLALISMTLILLIAAVNLFSHEINTRAPYYVARSAQLVMIEKGETYRTIGDSQDVRNDAIEQALIEWRADNRVFLFGRSVYHISFKEADFVKKKYGNEGFVINAMKSGRTHNMITDLLLQYGIVGCSLYIFAYFMVIRFFWKLRRTISIDSSARWLVDSMAIYLPIMFLYQALGGNFMPIVAALAIGLLRAHLVTLEDRDLSPKSSQNLFRRLGGQEKQTRESPVH